MIHGTVRPIGSAPVIFAPFDFETDPLHTPHPSRTPVPAAAAAAAAATAAAAPPPPSRILLLLPSPSSSSLCLQIGTAPTLKKTYYEKPVLNHDHIFFWGGVHHLGEELRSAGWPVGCGRRQESDKREEAVAGWRECNLFGICFLVLILVMVERGAFDDAMDAAFVNVRWMQVGHLVLLRCSRVRAFTSMKSKGTRREVQQKLCRVLLFRCPRPAVQRIARSSLCPPRRRCHRCT